MASAESTMNRSTPRVLFNGGIYLFWLLVMLALALIAADWLLKPVTYPVQRVSFEGPFQHVHQAELEQAALTDLSGSFLTVDLDAAQRRVEALPWIERAWVSRRWPDAIHIRFTEQRFVARWNDGAWLNGAGQAVALPDRDGPAGLVQLSGPAGTEADVLTAWRMLDAQLQQIKLVIVRLELTRRRMWTLALANGAELVIGRNRLEERMKRFVQIYPFLAKEGRRIRRVDLRYANGLAVVWADGRQGTAGQHYAR